MSTRLKVILASIFIIVATAIAPSIASADGTPAPKLTGVSNLDGCPKGWGSLLKENPALGTGEVDNLRTGQHKCFDRVVVDIDGPPAGYRVEYVDQVTADGSGAVVPTPGGARLQFVVHHNNFHGPAVGTKVANVKGYRTLRSVTYAGSFEGYTTYGVGVRARLPFRVFTIPGGHGRIVLDIAHHW